MVLFLSDTRDDYVEMLIDNVDNGDEICNYTSEQLRVIYEGMNDMIRSGLMILYTGWIREARVIGNKGAFWHLTGAELLDDYRRTWKELPVDIFSYFNQLEHQEGQLRPLSKFECLELLLLGDKTSEN